MAELDNHKSDRILDIYSQLMAGHVVNKAELAAKYDVTKKSIQRDLDTIRDFLENKNAASGKLNTLVYDRNMRGYRLEYTDRTKLTNSEILALCKILLDSRAFPKKEMKSILDRLVGSCVPENNRRVVSDLILNEMHHYIAPRHGKSVFKDLWTLGEAIREQKLIRIRYKSLKNERPVTRQVKPLAITFSEFYFYLVGYIVENGVELHLDGRNMPSPTIYRIDRISSLKVLDEHFTVHYGKKFNEGEFRKRIQFMMGGELRHVTFLCNDIALEATLDRLPTAVAKPAKGGWHRIDAEVFGDGIDMWLRSQGENIKALGS